MVESTLIKKTKFTVSAWWFMALVASNSFFSADSVRLPAGHSMPAFPGFSRSQKQETAQK